MLCCVARRYGNDCTMYEERYKRIIKKAKNKAKPFFFFLLKEGKENQEKKLVKKENITFTNKNSSQHHKFPALIFPRTHHPPSSTQRKKMFGVGKKVVQEGSHLLEFGALSETEKGKTKIWSVLKKQEKKIKKQLCQKFLCRMPRQRIFTILVSFSFYFIFMLREEKRDY